MEFGVFAIDTDTVEFQKTIKTALENVSQKDCLMTIGIMPTRPDTGYGYIQFVQGETNIRKVKTFTEKPDLEIAKSFIESGDFLWNAGIFVWSAENILKSFQKLPK